jgi:hypothetical protein
MTYAPVKGFVNRAFESWLRNFPEKIFYKNPFTVNQLLQNTFAQTIANYSLLLITIGKFNTVFFFSDEDFSLCAETERPLQGNENVEKFWQSCSHASKSHTRVIISNQPLTSGLNTGQSSSITNLLHMIHVKLCPLRRRVKRNDKCCV